MVPSLERTERMEELRNVADNMVREQLEHAEVVPLAHNRPRTDNSSCDMAQTPSDKGHSVTAAGSEAHSGVVEESQRKHVEVDVGPAFLIPMTQAKSLEELPSKLDVDCQNSEEPNHTPALGAARNLDDQLDGVGTLRCVAASEDVGMDTFQEVSQIAQEAVMHAVPQPHPSVPSSDLGV